MKLTRERGLAYFTILAGSIISGIIVQYAPYNNFILRSVLPAIPVLIGFAAGMILIIGEYKEGCE